LKLYYNKREITGKIGAVVIIRHWTNNKYQINTRGFKMESVKQRCEWCGRLGEEDVMIDCGNSLLDMDSMWYHEDCYDEAKDNQ